MAYSPAQSVLQNSKSVDMVKYNLEDIDRYGEHWVVLHSFKGKHHILESFGFRNDTLYLKTAGGVELCNSIDEVSNKTQCTKIYKATQTIYRELYLETLCMLHDLFLDDDKKTGIIIQTVKGSTQFNYIQNLATVIMENLETIFSPITSKCRHEDFCFDRYIRFVRTENFSAFFDINDYLKDLREAKHSQKSAHSHESFENTRLLAIKCYRNIAERLEEIYGRWLTEEKDVDGTRYLMESMYPQVTTFANHFRELKAKYDFGSPKEL